MVTCWNWMAKVSSEGRWTICKHHSVDNRTAQFAWSDTDMIVETDLWGGRLLRSRHSPVTTSCSICSTKRWTWFNICYLWSCYRSTVRHYDIRTTIQWDSRLLPLTQWTCSLLRWHYIFLIDRLLCTTVIIIWCICRKRFSIRSRSFMKFIFNFRFWKNVL